MRKSSAFVPSMDVVEEETAPLVGFSHDQTVLDSKRSGPPGMGILVLTLFNALASVCVLAVGYRRSHDICDQPLSEYLIVTGILQIVLDGITCCLYVEKTNVAKGNIDAVAGVLCVQWCCVAPLFIALVGWNVHGVVTAHHTKTCSWTLKAFSQVYAWWFLIYSIVQMLNLWRTSSQDRVAFFKTNQAKEYLRSLDPDVTTIMSAGVTTPPVNNRIEEGKSRGSVWMERYMKTGTV